MNKKAILEEMLFDEEAEFKKLISKAKLVVNVKKSNGQPVVLHKDELSQEEQVGCFTLGKYFAKELGLAETSEVTVNEVSEALGIEKKIVVARFSDLDSKDVIDRPGRGKYTISFLKLEEFLDSILSKINSN